LPRNLPSTPVRLPSNPAITNLLGAERTATIRRKHGSVQTKMTSQWLRRDLIRRVERLGLPVTAIVPCGRRRLARDEMVEEMGRFIAGGV
jgi:hypothetical protein